jgi:hypothetical protein
MKDTSNHAEETPSIDPGSRSQLNPEKEGQAGFVVKATTQYGLEMWLSSAGTKNPFGPRKTAEVFKTRADASTAIRALSPAFEKAGFVFSVDPT